MAALAESELPHASRGVTVAWGLASDDALVRATARGHDGAFAALFSRYHAPLVRYCRSMLLDADDAQDAAQNALTAALRSLRSERAALPLRLRPWLYRIAHNEALAVARRRPASTGLDEEAAALAAPDDVEAREAFRELLGDLRRLPERQRSALVLRELEGLSYAEVAGALDVSGDAARQAVFEARAALSAHRDGRATACVDVRRRLSEGDGRTARSRALRAHLDDCAGCTAFAEEIRGRRRALRVLFPMPGIVALGSGSGAAVVGLGGASIATKCAALCATAVVLGGSVAALETTSKLHAGGGVISATAGPTPMKRPAPRPAPVTTTATTTQAALRLPAAKPARRARHMAVRPVAKRTVAARIQATPHRERVVTANVPARPAPTTTTTTTVAPPTQQASTPATTTSAPTAAQRRQQLSAALAAATQEAIRRQVAAAQQSTAQLLTGVQQTVNQTVSSTQQGLLELQRRILAGLTGQTSGQ